MRFRNFYIFRELLVFFTISVIFKISFFSRFFSTISVFRIFAIPCFLLIFHDFDYLIFFQCNDNEKLNDIAILCCEFTAQCQSLSSEWLGALGGLCNSVLPDGSPVYSDLKNFINMNDQSIYSRVGIFVSVLIARNCFNMPYMMADIGNIS